MVAAADAAILLAVAATAADIKFYPKQTRIVIQLSTLLYTMTRCGVSFINYMIRHFCLCIIPKSKHQIKFTSTHSLMYT